MVGVRHSNKKKLLKKRTVRGIFILRVVRQKGKLLSERRDVTIGKVDEFQCRCYF